MNETTNPANRQIARAAGTVMLAFLFSQLTGLVTKILIARTFPANEVDAFLAANRPSEALVFITTGGIFVSSFIPVFVKFLVKEDRRSAWQLASAIANLILIIMTVAAGLMILFAGPIVKNTLVTFFPPEKQELTVELLRIQAASAVFFGLSGLLIGILNSHQKFLASALTPAMYQAGQIFGILVLAPKMGVYGLAWGVVVGSVFYLLIQVPTLLRLKGQYISTLGLYNPAVGEVLRLMGPRMLGAAAVQLMVIINNLLASKIDGGVYSLTYGFSLMMVAQIAIAQSIGTAAMPTFSAQYAQGKLNDVRQSLASTLRGVTLLSIPAAVGLILLGKSIIAFLYQRGEFTAESTQMVAWALLWYTVGLVFHSFLEVLVRAYYAMHDTKTPVLISVAATILSVGLSLLFSALFSKLGWRAYGGLALAVSISTALEVTTLFFLMRKRLSGIHGPQIAKGFGVAALGTFAMAAALVFWVQATKSQTAALTALGGVVIGATVYGLALVILRVPEVFSLFQMVKRRLGR